MNKPLIENFISQQRFERYWHSCNRNDEYALRAYEANILLSQSFYPLLSILEIALRNRLNIIMGAHFHDENWIFNGVKTSGFLSHAKLGKKFVGKAQVCKVIEDLKIMHKDVRQQLIPNLPFSFWARFYQADYFGVLAAKPIDVFSFSKRKLNRDEVHKMLKGTVDFRNRIYHNEPICFGIDRRNSESILDLTSPSSVYDNIYTLLFWMGGVDILSWLKMSDTVPQAAEIMNTIIDQVGKGRSFSIYRR